MWLSLLLIAIIALCAFAVVTGTIWMAIPIVALAVMAFLAYSASIRSHGDHLGRAESGPRGDTTTGTDTPGGPTHEVTGYAHEGQAHTGA